MPSNKTFYWSFIDDRPSQLKLHCGLENISILIIGLYLGFIKYGFCTIIICPQNL